MSIFHCDGVRRTKFNNIVMVLEEPNLATMNAFSIQKKSVSCRKIGDDHVTQMTI